MAARLGDVLYIAGWIGATLVGLFGAVVIYSGMDASDAVVFGVITVVVASLIWLAGRAARYVLAGR